MTVSAEMGQTTYVDTFFRELSPAWIDYVAALGGVPCARLDAPFTYLELGCGFGQSSIVNAAAFPNARFVACDIDPRHIDAARDYAAALGVSNLELLQASFEALSQRDLPQFDFVVLHGVYSWVGADARRAVRALLARHVRPGGLVYVSYNCQPGWAVEMPLRRLLRELVPPTGDPERRIEAAVDALQRLADAGLGYFANNASARSLARAYRDYPTQYIAHEFLAEDWQAFFSVDVDTDMREAGLRYVGSATLADNHPGLILNDTSSAAIAQLPARQRRLAEDFAANRYFRRDVYVRGEAQISDRTHLSRVVVANPEASIATQVRVPRGVITFQDAFVRELGAIVARGSISIGSLTDLLSGAGRSRDEIARNVTILLAAGALVPCAVIEPYRAVGDDTGALACDPTTRAALDHAIEHGVGRALPSRLLGNGIQVDPVTALALRARIDGCADRTALADRVEREVRARRWSTRTLTHAPHALDARRATDAALDTTLPILQRLGLVTERSIA